MGMMTGASLAWARRRVGLSRLALARALHASPRLVADWEARHAPIPADALEAIAAAITAGRMAQAQRERARLERLEHIERQHTVQTATRSTRA